MNNFPYILSIYNLHIGNMAVQPYNARMPDWDASVIFMAAFQIERVTYSQRVSFQRFNYEKFISEWTVFFESSTILFFTHFILNSAENFSKCANELLFSFYIVKQLDFHGPLETKTTLTMVVVLGMHRYIVGYLKSTLCIQVQTTPVYINKTYIQQQQQQQHLV